jgi:excisionase family DNA binding protein
MNDPHQLRLVTEDDTPAGPAPMVQPATDPPSADPAKHTVAPSLDDYGDVLTVEEAAALLRISRGSAYDAARLWRATRAEGLPVIQIGRRLLVPRTALEMILARPAQLYAEAASPSDD